MERSVRQQDGDSFEPAKRFKSDKRPPLETRNSVSPDSNSNDKSLDAPPYNSTSNPNRNDPIRRKLLCDLQSDSNGSCSSGSSGHKSLTRSSDRNLDRGSDRNLDRGSDRTNSDRNSERSRGSRKPRYSDRSPDRNSNSKTDRAHPNSSGDSRRSGSYRNLGRKRSPTRNSPTRKSAERKSESNLDERNANKDNRNSVNNYKRKPLPTRPNSQSVFSEERSRFSSTRHHSNHLSNHSSNHPSNRPSSRGSNNSPAPLNSSQIELIYSQNINLNGPNDSMK